MIGTISTITNPIIKLFFSDPLFKKDKIIIVIILVLMVPSIWGVLTFGAHYPNRGVKKPDSTRGS